MSDDQRSRGNDIAIARYVPPVSVPDMRVMAQAMVASKLFGYTSEAQALTLMWLCQAEGRHPVLAARDYDIILGKPAKKAEAMMRDFISAGGTVEWHRLDDDVADATFSHPRGGEVHITWDMNRAKQAGLLGKTGDMWRKYPRQMLRSRCVSEGIRTVGPMATSGLFVPEEVGDFEPRRPRGMKDVTPPPAPAPYDPETGEVFETPAALPDRARRMAEKGTDMLRAWLRDLSPDDRASLRELIGTADQPGELLTLARHADAEALQERLRTPHAREEAAPDATPPPPQESASEAPAATEIPADGSPPERRPSRPAAARTSAGPPPRSTIWQDESYAVPLRDAHGGPDWESWVTAMAHLAGEATEAEREKLLADNKDTLLRLRVSDRTRHASLMHDIGRAE